MLSYDASSFLDISRGTESCAFPADETVSSGHLNQLLLIVSTVVLFQVRSDGSSSRL